LEVAQVHGLPIAGEEIYQQKVNPIYGNGDDPQADPYDLIAESGFAIIVE
jgi:hypothetical protein